jgi:hypothetical protein
MHTTTAQIVTTSELSYEKSKLFECRDKNKKTSSGSVREAILLEDVLGMKKCRQKHGGFSRITPFPWQLVPLAHEITTDQAQFWAHYNFHTPMVLSKIFLLFSKFLQ